MCLFFCRKVFLSAVSWVMRGVLPILCMAIVLLWGGDVGYKKEDLGQVSVCFGYRFAVSLGVVPSRASKDFQSK